MCINIDVNLPTVVSFLMLYSLRCGCKVICAWTLFRAFCFLIFFTTALLETFLPHTAPLGPTFHPKPKPPAVYDSIYFVFMAFLIMIVTECFLLLFCYYFGMGLYYECSGTIRQYLVCRFCTWLIEASFVTLLSVAHHDLIGWYLAFLMIVIVEIYGFIVAYSYYKDMMEERKAVDEDDFEQNDAADLEGLKQ